MKTISLEEVAKHTSKKDVWVIIHGKVYDLTAFLPEHPGGQKIIMKYAGRDATKAFDPIHPPDIIDRFLSPEVCLGEVDAASLASAPKVETEQEKQLRIAHENKPRLDEMYNAFDFESVAKNVLPPDAWAYYSSGSDDEVTMRENHNAFHRIWLRPRVMVDVAKIDMNTSMLGTKTAIPLYITATALGKLGHPDGEKVLTRAAAKRDVIQMIPTLASCSFDEIVATRADNQTQWLQLYVNSDRRREKDMRQKYSQEAPDEMDNDDSFQRDEGAARAISAFIDPSLNWKDVAWFKSITKMPIIIKGIQTAEDAVLAWKYGCAGVVLSNHGGRQLDFAPSAVEILPEVIDALKREGCDPKKDFDVYIDGGIRRGSDIFKAVALGAKGVGIGRPFLFAMSGYGDKGVERLIQLYQDELEMCMRLMGAKTIEDITPDMVDIRNLKDHFVANPTDYLAKHAYEKMHPRGNLSKL
ncbi:hypothetical protein BDC45DRAFT_431869 [Circinella umbellata]|nr:hypothetical protein BDC45DRAFT_431869 [Circinella umbellata]